ncbi:MAG: carbohydrate-binding protein [Opitutaceae bacterium]
MKKLPPNRRWSDTIKRKALTALGLLSFSLSHALVVNVDIDASVLETFSGQGGYADSGNDYWNSSVNGLNDLTASDGVTASTIDLAISTTNRYSVIGGNIPAGQSHSNLVGDYSYARDADITVDISGLEPSEPYRLYIYCQGDQLSQKATVTFPGNSSVSTTGLVDGTIAEGQNYVVMDVTSDASGIISGTIARNGSRYVAINGIQIVELNPSVPRTFVHPGIGLTVADLDHIKARLTVEPWKTGYDDMAAKSTASLSYVMQGPYVTVSHKKPGNPQPNDPSDPAWENDMEAVHNLARMWYFTDNAAYAQKARDILITWANNHTLFDQGEVYLEMGYRAHQVFEGVEILRGTWPGWTQADTDTLKTYFENVWWNSPYDHLAVPDPLRSANQGMSQLAAALGVAVFLDDEVKFEQCLKAFRSDAAAALGNTLPNGQIGDNGRDAHDQGQLMLMAWCAEVFWNQGVDVYSEYDNRLLAAGEYLARFNLLVDTPFIQAGTVYDIYSEFHQFDGPYTNWGFESKMITLLHTAYVVRQGLRAPYLEQFLSYAPQNESSFCHLMASDSSTATAYPALPEPASVDSVTSLNNAYMGNTSAGSSTYNAGSKTWTVSGNGPRMWYSAAPDYHFAYLPVTGDATIIAKLTSLTGGSTEDARAGIVFTSDLTNTADMQAIIVTHPSGTDPQTHSFRRGDVAHSHQGNPGDRSYLSQSSPKIPYWLKIERIGNRVNCYSSPDGISWSCGESADYAIGTTAYFGLAVSSDQTSAQSTATFTDVRITGGDGGEAIEAPEAPFAIYASPGGDQVPLRWLESFEADSYNIWRSTQSGGPYTLLTQQTGTSYVDISVDYGTHYYYAVSAVNSVGESPLSSEEKFKLVDTTWYEAEYYDAQSGFGLENTSDFFGGQNLSNSHAGDWAAYYDIPLEAGAVFKARMASYGTEIGQIEVRLGSTTGTLVGTLPGLNTGGAQSWGSDEVALSGYTAGVYDIYLVLAPVTGETGVAMNLNWFDITYPNVTEYDLGMDVSLTYDSANHSLTNLGDIPEWGVVSTHLKLQDGSDLSNVDFAALGLTSWTTNDFDSATVTTWDGANLSGITLYVDGNFGAGDSFAGADFSNVVWGNATSTADLFSGGSGASSAATQDDAINFQGADLSLITGASRAAMINNLGGFDGSTPIGAKFDPVFIVNSGWDSAALLAAGWQYNAVDAFATIQAEDYDDQFGINTENCSEGGLNVAGVQNGDWVAYYSVDFGSGADEFQARVASNTSGGNIEIRLDSPTGTLVGTAIVSGTGHWQNWTTVTASVSGLSGAHDLYLVFTGGSGYLLNLNWVTFTSTSTTYTLTYTSGAGGSISGTSPQVVNPSANGTAVTAVPDTGYQFVNWSDSSTDNPRTDTNVTSDITVTANFQTIPNKDAFATIEAEIYDNQSGVSTQSCSEGGLNVQAIDNTDWVAYSNVDFGSGANEFQARVASNTSGGNIEIRLNSPTGTLLGTCIVNGTGGWQAWTTVSTSISSVSGVQDVYLVFTGGAGSLFNLNWFTFTSTSTTYTLTYSAAAGGSISGTSPQVISAGGNGTAVTAVADANYSFVNWSDGSTANPRTDTNVTGDVTVTANFAINSYTLTYTAGANGSISGSSPQSVNHGSNGSAVTAVPDTGYSFVNWSDGSTANPRTDTNVTSGVNVTANFTINSYSLTYTAGSNGSITGTSPQTVDHGSNGTAVSAVADTGYSFVNWSDSSTDNPRTDLNVTGDVTVTAIFAINTYTLTYSADANGSITGSSSQTVDHGTNGSAVTAVPNVEYYFVDWNDGSTENPRTDLNVTGDVTVTANFSTPVAYNGPHTIPGLIEAEDYDAGIEGYGYHDTTAGNSGGAYRSDDVDVEVTGDTSGGYNVSHTAAGEWLEYLVENVIAGEYLITLRVANYGSASDVRIAIDGIEIDTVSVPNTGGAQSYTDVTAAYSVVLATTDPVVLSMEFLVGSINVNWIDITAAPVNNPPVFTVDPISTSNATENAAYSETINGSATDPELDPITYSKVSGPAWLSVAADGILSGTPSAGDVGANVFTVAASDGVASDTATLNITVDAAVASWTQIDSNDFESDWGIWNGGGSDARLSSSDAAYANGTYCVRLRDNTSTSVMTTNNLTLSGYSELKVEFSYICVSMDNSNEDFWLQISTDGGVNFTTVEEWNEGDEFVNDVRYNDSVTILGYSLNDQTQLRFRCDASGNSDWVYIDDVVISAK